MLVVHDALCNVLCQIVRTYSQDVTERHKDRHTWKRVAALNVSQMNGTNLAHLRELFASQIALVPYGSDSPAKECCIEGNGFLSHAIHS